MTFASGERSLSLGFLDKHRKEERLRAAIQLPSKRISKPRLLLLSSLAR